MNVIDVYDIATSTWYKQSTSGSYPVLRVNPCAVAASAPDGSSTNIYMYGGQNLIPYENQTQYSDMWILTVPSFTWINVDTAKQSAPTARVGHTCDLHDGQMIVIGGYNTDANRLSCDTGFYVFDATNLTWTNSFKALSGDSPSQNPQNQQQAQQKDLQGLSGSYGYQVPGAIQSVIGGGPTGGATLTTPVLTPTAGPLATGKAITYTVQGTYTITGADGAVVTETGTTTSTTQPSKKGPSGPNIGAIVGGVLAGFFFIVACYLGFCAWVYRRQLALYKNHVAMTQRAAVAGGPGEKAAFLGDSTSKDSSSARRWTTDQSSAAAGSGSGYTGHSSGPGAGSVPPVPTLGAPVGGNSTANSSTEELGRGLEPTFVGVLLNPRRSLRVINRD